MINKEELLIKNLELIPISDLTITYDPNEKIGYDFTVEDNYTFSTDDGIFIQDTMSVVLPLSNEAQEEVKRKMTRIYSGESYNAINFALEKEMYVGIYLMTKQSHEKNNYYTVTEEELNKINDPFRLVTYNGKPTSAGRAMFNACLPEDYPFIDKQIGKKDVNGIINDIVLKYPQEVVEKVISKLYKLGFKFSGIFSPSIILDYIDVPDEIYRLKGKLKVAALEDTPAILEEMKKVMIEHLKGTGIYDLIESGGGKGWDQPLQILVSKGVITDVTGELIAISGSFSEGLDNKNFFGASAGSRYGICARALLTADTGYLNRKLVYLLNGVEADPYIKDCGTKRTLDIRLTSDIMKKIQGRFVVRNNKLEEFNSSDYKIGDIVKLRSPIYCESEKICHVCYGRLLERHKSRFIGVMSGTILGEKSTNASLKHFHSGGTVKVIKRNMIKDIIENNPNIEMEQ